MKISHNEINYFIIVFLKTKKTIFKKIKISAKTDQEKKR